MRWIFLRLLYSTFSQRLGILAIALALQTSLATASDAECIRLAVTCQAQGHPAPEIQDLITASLSSDPQVQLLERAQIDLLLQEGALIQNPERRVQLGRFLSLDYFLNIRQGGTREKPADWVIEAVNAQSGQVIGSATLPAESTANVATALATEATKLIHQRLVGKPVAKQEGLGTTRIAVLDFSGDEPLGIEESGRALRLSADVREFLSGGGLVVLDRALAQQVVREHGYQQEGLLEDKPDRLPLLGADVVVAGKIRHPGGVTTLEMTLLGAREGRVIAAQSFAYDPAHVSGSLPEAAREWLLNTLHPVRTVERTFEESIQVEALEPFYLGIAKFFAGQVLEATDAFQKAYTLNEKFADAMLWEARCYDALGLKPIADAERRFVRVGLIGRGFASSGKSNADDAITFLGITSGLAPVECDVAKNLEMLAIDQISRGETRLQLASHLAPLRDEYDVLVGTVNSRGTRWTDAPSFLSNRSLRGELSSADKNGARTLTWILVDNLSGKTFPKITATLGKDAASWRKEIESGMAVLLKTASESVEETPASLPPLPPVTELEKQISSRNGISANVPLLGLVLSDPANPLIPGRSLSKGDHNTHGLSAFLNFGLREFILQRMPKNDPKHAWLELQQLHRFAGRDQSGRYFSGKKIDTRAALNQFLADHPADIAGCLAEYTLLFDQLGNIDPEALSERFKRLETRISKFSEADIGDWHLLKDRSEALRVTSLIAAGKASSPTLPTDDYATPLFVDFDRGGKPRLEGKGEWVTNEWEHISDSANRAPEEARASLAILGRGDNLRRVDPRWLTDFPNSSVMLGYAIDALGQAKEWRGRPLLHEFDAEAERQHFRNIVSYSHRGLLQHLDRAAAPAEVGFLDDLASRFVHYLTESVYIDTVRDKEWEEMRQALISHLDAASTRVGGESASKSHRFKSDWRTVSRRSKSAPASAVQKERPLEASPDRVKLLAEEHAAGEISWRTSPLADTGWSKLVHSQRFKTQFNTREVARMHLSYLPRLKEIFPGPDFSSKELIFLHEFGSTLVDGGETAAAEEVFTRMLKAQSDNNGKNAELLANAALEMTWICRAAGRKAEALEYARRSLDMRKACGNEDGDADGSDAVALRLISDLRNDSQTAVLPQRVKTVVTRTPNLANAEVTFYYRVPPNYDPTKVHTALIIAAIQNDGALSYCLDSSPWARFADEHGVFLVVPQFINFSGGSNYQAGQGWSGQAVLDALEKIREQYNIDTKRLLLHGYGAGSAFVQRFARWVPDRCAGLSLHSTAPWVWNDWVPGAQPLSRLRAVPCLVTTGEEDDFSCFRSNRLAAAIQWVTMARGAGVPVLWKAWPGLVTTRSRKCSKCVRRSSLSAWPRTVGNLRLSVIFVQASITRQTTRD